MLVDSAVEYRMINIPILRWGQPYTSLQEDNVVHFISGETLAKVGQANPGLLAKDVRQIQRARDVLREIPCFSQYSHTDRRLRYGRNLIIS